MGQAITGTLDPDTPNSSPIVKYYARHDASGLEENCSATFVTPRLLLTAAHCMQETSGVSGLRLQRVNYGTVIAVKKQGPGPDPSTDAALLFLERASSVGADQSTWAEVLSWTIQRPWNTLPPWALLTPPGPEGSGFNGDSTERHRGAAASLSRHAGYWVGSAPDLIGGNSGGPIYTTDATGARRPFGVALESDFQSTNIWWDATHPTNAAWLSANAVDTERSATWKLRHGWVGTEWYGDVDYAGACDPARDPDCDHWYTEHDSCPRTFNPEQLDTDDDGVGDACDNCFKVKNPSQANCNLVAERAALARKGPDPGSSGVPATEVNFIKGDACDAVPCAAGSADSREWTDTNCVRVGDHDECTSRVISNLFHTPTVGSADPTPADGLPHVTVVPNVPTHFRFCQPAERPPYQARCDEPFFMQNQQVSAGEEPANSLAPWHRVRFGGVGTPSATTRVWDYGATTTSLRWRHEEDIAAWFSGFGEGIVLPDTCTSSNRALCLAGTFWMHAETSVGEDLRKIKYLSNRFTPVVPERGTIGYCPMVPEGILELDPVPSARSARTRQIALGPGIRVGLAVGIAGAQGGIPRPSVLAVSLTEAAQTRFGPMGSLRDDGFVVPLAPRTAPEPVSACSESGATEEFSAKFKGVRWASVVDPNSWSSVLSPDFAAVGLEGRNVVGARASGEVLQLVDNVDEVVDLGGDAPEAIVDPAVVLSRAAGGFFFLGGVDELSAEPSTAIWFHPLPGPWTRLQARLEPGETVLDATYSFTDRHLWAVVSRELPEPTWELVRLDVRDGRRDTVYRFPYAPGATGASPILTVDRVGAIVVSMARAQDTRQAKFWEEEGALYGQLLEPLAGKLHRAMVVDDIDYASIVEVPDGLTVTRHADLTTEGPPVTCPCDSTFGEAL